MSINLQQFCGTDISRDYLMQPWSLGEYTYATNGHILVQVPRIDGVPENSRAPSKKLSDVLDPQRDAACEPLPALKLPEVRKRICYHCDGTGRGHECPNCACVCTECSGEKSVSCEDFISCEVDGFLIALKYLRMIAALPNAKMAKGSPSTPVRFTFDGGEGRIMGLRDRYADHVLVQA